MSIEFGTSQTTGFSPITSYTAQIDYLDGNSFVDFGNYTESTNTVDFAIDSLDSSKLQPGSRYRFRSYATNALGTSDYSLEIILPAATLPSQPTGLAWSQTLSNMTSIGVTWNAVAATEVSTTGYKLYRDNGNDGNFSLIYDGTNRPGQRAFVSTGLNTGTYYRFKVSALNALGESDNSTELIRPACMPPSSVTPYSIAESATETTILLNWDAPESTNGCQITGFNLYSGTIDDTTLTIDSTSSSGLSVNPYSRSVTVSFTATDSGTTYKFQLETMNAAGSSFGGIAQAKLAGKPDAPTTGPVNLASQTNGTQITVQIFTTTPDLGEGTLRQVHLQMDNGGDGDYRDLIGPDST